MFAFAPLRHSEAWRTQALHRRQALDGRDGRATAGALAKAQLQSGFSSSVRLRSRPSRQSGRRWPKVTANFDVSRTE